MSPFNFNEVKFVNYESVFSLNSPKVSETYVKALVSGFHHFSTSESEQDQESKVATQVEKYHHTIPKYPLSNILQELLV